MLQSMLIDSLRFFRSHYIAIASIILPFVIPVEIFEIFYKQGAQGKDLNFSEAFLPMLVDVLTYPVYTAAVIFYISSVISDNTIGIKEAWKLGINCWFLFFVLNVMVSSLIVLGAIMFILPGLFFLIRYAFAEFELLLNKHAPLDAMRNSWVATEPYMITILAGFAIIIVGLYAPFYGLVLWFDQQELSLGYLVNIMDAIYAVLEVIYTIFLFRVYCHAKEQKSGLRV